MGDSLSLRRAVAGALLSSSIIMVSFAAGCGGHEEAAPSPPTTRLDAMSAGAIPDTPVTGSIGGEEFTVVEARYRVEQLDGRQRVDLLLSDTPLRRCGLPIVREGRMVWLRFDGVTSLPVGEASLALDAEEPTFSLHYEAPMEEAPRRYHGRGEGDALVSFGEPVLGHIAGKLFACFGDAHGSCVKGSFIATPCFSRVDGRAVREGVGLEDEALEPAREGDGETTVIPTAGGGDTEGSTEPVPDLDAPGAAQEEAE